MGSIGGEEAMQVSTDRQERILVTVRLRPLNSKERARNDVSDWECINDTALICRDNLSASDKSLYPTSYTFDRVFRPDCPTSQVYEEGAKKVALSVVSGINSSIFAYGQTSSGKTFTMIGVTEYTVADIYHYIKQHKEREFVLKLSAIEIYNECVRDLLSLDSTPRRLLDDPERGTVVERLTEETLSDWNHFIELLSFCKTQRQIGETSLNEASSRSHQILRLTIESSTHEFLGNDKSSSLAASVNFVDLAGSERASQTLSAGTRLKEGCHINRSLLTLGTVVRKLSKGRNGHIPFRDSKLTRILQSSLGGNARTAIICTISPARSHVEQTRNTLLFASCAKEVATNAKVNVLMSDKALVKQLQREVTRLESELKKSRSAYFISDFAAQLSEKDLEIQKLKKEVAELTMQRDLAQSQIKNMLQMVGDDMSSTELESLDPQYPKSHIRRSWDFDNKEPETPNLSIFQYMESVRSFDASPFSDGHSLSSDENLFQLADFELNLPRINYSSVQSVTDFDVERSDLNPKYIEEQHDGSLSDLNPKYIEEQHDGSLEDSCMGVMHNKSEDNTCTDSNPADVSPNPYSNSNASSPWANIVTSGLTQVDHSDEANLNLVSPALSITSTSRSLKMARSGSCKASLMTNRSSFWFEKEEIIDNTPPTAIEKHFTGRPEDHIHQLDYNNNAERLPRNGSGNSVVSPSVDVQNVKFSAANESDREDTSATERKEKEKENHEELSSLSDHENVKSSPDNESDREDTSTTERKEKEKENHKELNLLSDHEAPESRLECIMPTRSSKNVGLDPMQSDEEGHLDWPSEFSRLQKEIIELWHACHVSLYHRTYFFLLIKGNSSDSIYMEVEYRRLSYLMQTFSQGNHKEENGRKVALASSMRNLRRERQVLSKQIQKRLSKSERHNVYLKWGIRLSSRKRRLQLANRLWSEIEDMDHIRESAALVARLVGLVEPDRAFKEMFGLKFAPPSPPSLSISGRSFACYHY